MKLFKKLIYSLIFYFIPLILFGQRSVLDKEFFPKYYIGLTGGYGLHTYQNGYSVFEAGNPCGDFSDGTGKGIIAGITFEYLLSKKLSIVGDILYEDRSGSFNQSQITAPLRQQDNNLINGSIQQNLDITLNYISIMPSVKYKLFKFGFGVTAGLGFNLLMKNLFIMNENIITPGLVYNIPGNPTTLKILEGDITSVNSFIVDAKFGLFQDIPLSAHVMLSPRVLFSYPILKVTKDYEWKIQSLQFLVTLNYGF